MLINKKYFLLLIIFLTQKSFSFTLDDALKLGLTQSSEIKILKHEKEIIEWKRVTAFSEYLPHLSLGGRHNFDIQFQELEINLEGNHVVFPAIQPYTDFGLRTEYNLFNGFKTKNAINAIDMNLKAVNSQLERKIEIKKIEIKSLYFSAIGAQFLVAVADQNIETLKSHLNDVKARIASGVSSKYDLLRVEVQLDNALAEKEKADNEVILTRAKLFNILNMKDNGDTLKGTLPKKIDQINVDIIDVKEVKRKDYIALLAQAKLANSEYKMSQYHWYPKISLVGNYDWYNNINNSVFESNKRFKNAYAFGIAFTWNLFDGGKDYAIQKEQSLKYKIVKEKIIQFENKVLLDLERAKREYNYNIVNYKAKQSSISKAKEAVRLARDGISTGTRTNTEVLDAVLDLNRAKAEVIKSQVNAIIALGKLELAVGHKL